MAKEDPSTLLEKAARAADMETALSRRGFLRFSACAATSLAALGLCEALGANAPVVILDNAKGLILADPSRCVGCQRCELTCSEVNDKRAQPSLSRIKVARVLNYGPGGPTGGDPRGLWGNALVMPGVCRQCPHPVPCATACPNEAIVLDPATGARAVDARRCVGCRLCQRACPWGMMTFDEERQKASKCFLCNGKPKCVEACPSGALRFVPWRDITREGPPPSAVLSVTPAAKAKACADCHTPAAKKGARR